MYLILLANLEKFDVSIAFVAIYNKKALGFFILGLCFRDKYLLKLTYSLLIGCLSVL